MLHGDIRSDLIVSADFLTKSGINIKESSGTMEWFNRKLPVTHVRSYLTMVESLEVHHEEEYRIGRGLRTTGV